MKVALITLCPPSGAIGSRGPARSVAVPVSE